MVAPEFLNLSDKIHRRLTLDFIAAVRRHCAEGHRVLLDFSQVKKVFSCGTLLLLAEIDRIKRILGTNAIIKCSYPKDDVVEKAFQQIGLLRLLDKEHRLVITEEDKSVFYWRFSTGSCVSPDTADEMLVGIKKELPVGYRKIIAGIEEAMTNSVHHAYILSRGDELDGNFPDTPKRWWLFAQLTEGRLIIIICDLGIGIPETLRRGWMEEVADIVTVKLRKVERHKQMLERAFVLGRTRTELSHRGKGLKDIKKAAEELNGQLWVYSDDVCARFEYGIGSPNISYKGYKNSILGTVIQWSIPIKTGQDGE